jgi:hypothetical protein
MLRLRYIVSTQCNRKRHMGMNRIKDLGPALTAPNNLVAG